MLPVVLQQHNTIGGVEEGGIDFIIQMARTCMRTYVRTLIAVNLSFLAISSTLDRPFSLAAAVAGLEAVHKKHSVP